MFTVPTCTEPLKFEKVIGNRDTIEAGATLSTRFPGTGRPKGAKRHMTKADLIEEVSRLAELTRKDSEVIVETIFDSVVRSLRVGDKIEIRGFGSFRTRQRKPRVGRNPKTGDRVEVPGEEDSVLQAQQRTEGSGQQRSPPTPPVPPAAPPAPAPPIAH